jgi:hypothetical protein
LVAMEKQILKRIYSLQGAKDEDLDRLSPKMQKARAIAKGKLCIIQSKNQCLPKNSGQYSNHSKVLSLAIRHYEAPRNISERKRRLSPKRRKCIRRHYPSRM